MTDTQDGYGLLYGGIDSAGVTERATDMTSVMAGVAQSHAVQSSCPIVMKELHLLPETDRRLFGGVDTNMAPTFVSGKTFELEADEWSSRESLVLRGELIAGEREVSVSFLNQFWDEAGRGRHVRLDRLKLSKAAGEVVEIVELEDVDRVGGRECNHPVGDHFAFHCTGALYVPVTVPADGDYVVEVVAWADHSGDERPLVQVALHGDAGNSAGGEAIKAKLAELHDTLLGRRGDGGLAGSRIPRTTCSWRSGNAGGTPTRDSSKRSTATGTPTSITWTGSSRTPSSGGTTGTGATATAGTTTGSTPTSTPSTARIRTVSRRPGRWCWLTC